MKKANLTLFHPHVWSALKMHLLLAMLCVGVTTIDAQEQVLMPTDSISEAYQIIECGNEEDAFQFTDDGDNDGNYFDGYVRNDTVTFCPEDPWHIVNVVFKEFDIEDGDALFVYEGDRDTLRAAASNTDNDGDDVDDGAASLLIGSGSGVGVSNAIFGPNVGWVAATCDPTINPTGCLTFVFITDGQNSKGAGWEAWVNCEDRGVGLEAPDDIWEVINTCPATGAPTTTVNLTAATIDGNCTLSNNTVEVNVSGPTGTCVIRNVAPGATIPLTLGVGTYTVKHTLVGDRQKMVTSLVNVAAKSLTCNDEVTASLGAGCQLRVDLDMLLEGEFCDTTTGIQYSISIKNASGKEIASGTSRGGYPVIQKDDIPDFCGGAPLTATVTRTFDYSNTPTSCANGNANISEVCEVAISLFDESAPTFGRGSRTDTLYACDASGIDDLLTQPRVIDNCSESTMATPSYELIDGERCDTFKTYLVTWSATDECGNTNNNLTDTVRIMRSSVFVDAPDDVEIDCSLLDNGIEAVLADEDNRPGIEVGEINGGVLVAGDTLRLSEEDYVCDYVLSKQVDEVPSDCGRKFFVVWSVLDWCNPQNGISVLDTQFIKFVDTIAPELDTDLLVELEDIDENTNTFSLGHFDCALTSNPLPAVGATDNCGEPTVSMINVERKDGDDWNSVGANMGEAIAAAALVCDTFRVVYEATDDCHEQTEVDQDTTYFIVIDDVAPAAICTDELIVSVPNDWGLEIDVDDINVNSSDNCEVARIAIRRKGTDDEWTEKVAIDCDDVHENVEIEMRVWDAKGNYNTCWTTVTAEDKIPPVCDTLPDASITCKEIVSGELNVSTDTDGDGEFDDSEWQPLTGSFMETYNDKFGIPNCVDNLTCGDLVYEQEYQLIESDCGAMTIIRRYRANDWKPNASNWSQQRITVTYVPEWTLSFPADVDLDCGEDGLIPAPWTATEVIDNGSCDLWALEVTADTFEVGDGVCMKIERKYEVINWCVYEAGNPSTILPRDPDGLTITHVGREDAGRFTYTQVIKLYANKKPTNFIIDDVNTCIVGVGDAAPFNEEDQLLGAPAYECDTLRRFTASATNCMNVPLSSDNFNWKFYINSELVDEGDGNEFMQIVSPGVSYTVEFEVVDGCGNFADTSRVFEFFDCKKPTPYVLNGIAIELGEGGTVDIWAKDLDQGSFDNCTDQSRLEMYIGFGEPNAGPTNLEDIRALGSNLTLTCDNVGTQSVSIYVVDEAGNWDVVGTYVLVQNNRVSCNPGEGMVAGKIVTPNGENVEQVSVAIAGTAQESMTTGADGSFFFNVDAGGDYTVTPEKNMNPLNGVSTFDLVLISKHILGITTFDSPYKYIAADVNKSGTITAFDMVQLRQLILNITTEFTNNDSWRFIDAKHEFTTANPLTEAFNEFMQVDNLTTNMMDADFVGVKIGDVNINASSNSLLGAESRTTNGTLKFNVADRFVEAGETVTVDFTAADIAAAQGYQFTMNFAGLNFVSLEEGVAKAANFNTNLAERGVIATSWNGEATADQTLFSVTFNANTAGLLSELLSVSSDVTTAEAYSATGDLLDVSLEFAPATAKTFALGQNTPNPFKTETMIDFNLPQAGAVRLTVMDAQGKVLKLITGEYAKGNHQVVVKASELGATGVLYYQLESADQVATKKMIIIE